MREIAHVLSDIKALIKAGEKTPTAPYGDKTEYADPGFQSDGKKRYPIDTETHIRAAWSYVQKPQNARPYTKEQLDKIKARIVAAWKDKIDPNGPKGDGPPLAEDGKKAASVEMMKHLSDTGQVACMILDLKALKDRLALEAAIEGDDSPASAKVQEIIEELCRFLEALVAEETKEVVEGDEAPRILAPANAIYLTLPAGELKRKVEDLIAKAPRHTRENQAMLDLAHHAVGMARAIPGLKKAEDGHCEEAMRCMEMAGARESGVHRGAVMSPAKAAAGEDLEKGHAGHRVLIGHAHPLLERVKAGGGHSAETLGHLNAAQEHLHAAGAEELYEGAAMGAGKAAFGDLAKLEADFAALTQTVGALSERVARGAEALAALTAERDELKMRLAKVEAEPLPPRTVKLPPGITAVEKGGGSAAEPDLAAELQKLSPEEIQLLLIKAARRNPMRPVFAGPPPGIRNQESEAG